MLTTFIEDRPVKRLRGEEAVNGFQLRNTSSTGSPRTSNDSCSRDESIPSCTPGLTLGPAGTGIENTDNFEDSKIRSCQLRSLQRRFVVQQTFGTPEPLPANNNKQDEDSDLDGFVLHSQPAYERLVSQKSPEDVDGLVIDPSEHQLERSGIQIDLNGGCWSRKLEGTDDHTNQDLEKKDGQKCTPAVHSADRIQLNAPGAQTFFPIFRSKKDCKVLYMIRHGESEFNAACSARGSSWEDPLLFDARLTARGRAQALELRKDISSWILPKDAVWITSPLSRAVETLLHVHPFVEPSDFSFEAQEMEKVVILPDISERLHTSGDIGRHPHDLCKEFPMFEKQFSQLPKVWWYEKDGKANCPYESSFQSYEPKEHVRKRVKQFKQWLLNRPEKSFVAVGHSMFWRDFATACNNGIKQDVMRNYVGLFFAPGLAIVTYAYFKGKGNLKDGLSRLLTEVSQGYFQPSIGGENVPVAEGELSDLAGDEPLFKALYKWFLDNGGIFKLVFGPKAFLVISDPQVVRHILRDNAFNYDKGVLAEILEPIMGKGLIPADLETWKVRRRQIVPGFHKAYLENCISMFGRCTERTIDKLSSAAEESRVINMEEEFLNLGLDIIGLGVFNYDFGSKSSQNPVIQSVYGVLKEAEHRSTFYIPYWNLPLSKYLVPRQRQFQQDIKVINQCLDDLILMAKSSRREDDIEALQARDYSKVEDASLLRFLVDMRDADLEQKQLRDDLMTMLIAGHETTAAVLTWTLFLLATHPEIEAKVVGEIQQIGMRRPTLEDIENLPYVRKVLAESLRLYPQPPILIRRALDDDTLPPGLGGDPCGYPIGKGADLFISVWNLHRSPHLWKDPDDFRPERFDETFRNPSFVAWEGYDPGKIGSSLYPNEIASDFAFLPFGGGIRKCVGDQFAYMEATVAIVMLLSRFSFELATSPEEVGMATGATIHTANGLKCRVRKRALDPESKVGQNSISLH